MLVFEFHGHYLSLLKNYVVHRLRLAGPSQAFRGHVLGDQGSPISSGYRKIHDAN